MQKTLYKKYFFDEDLNNLENAENTIQKIFFDEDV